MSNVATTGLLDRRIETRTDVVAPARVRLARGKSSTSCGVAVTNISPHGMSFLSNDTFVIGDMIEVTLTNGNAWYEVIGNVRRLNVHPHADRIFVVGVRYLDTPDTAANTANIASWLENRKVH